MIRIEVSVVIPRNFMDDFVISSVNKNIITPKSQITDLKLDF